MLFSLLTALVSPAPPPAAAPRSNPAPATRLPSPQGTVEGYRFVVERLHQAQNLNAEFGASGPARVTGKQMLYLILAVHPPRREMVANIEGLDARVVGFSQKDAPVPFQSYPSDDVSPLAAGIWRTTLAAQEVDAAVDRLRRLQGDLIVYPRAQRVTLDFPARSALPLARTAEGVRVTVKSVRLKADALTVQAETEWPASDSIARVNAEAIDGFTAITRAGSILLPRRDQLATTRRGTSQVRQYTLVFPEVSEMPATLRFDVIARTGAPRKLPFVLPELPLPDAMDLTLELAEAEGETGPVDEGHPLYARAGATLRVPVKGAPGQALLIGLSRVEGGAQGPWRWIEAFSGSDGTALVSNLRPGRYRGLAILTDPGAGSPPAAPAGAAEVELVAGRTAALPAPRRP